MTTTGLEALTRVLSDPARLSKLAGSVGGDAPCRQPLPRYIPTQTGARTAVDVEVLRQAIEIECAAIEQFFLDAPHAADGGRFRIGDKHFN